MSDAAIQQDLHGTGQVLLVTKLKRRRTIMYTISDVVETGEAHELILCDFKFCLILDDIEPVSFNYEEVFDPN